MTAHFGETEAARYHLDYTIQTAEDQIGLTRDQEINRYHVEGTADYKLSDLASGTIVASGTVSAFTAYGASGTTIASRAANKDAYSRLITQLADKLLTDILAKLDTGE